MSEDIQAAAAQKALILNERPCGECAQFKLDSPALFSGAIGICRKKLMSVTRTMLANCPVGESCFEPEVADGTKDHVDE